MTFEKFAIFIDPCGGNITHYTFLFFLCSLQERSTFLCGSFSMCGQSQIDIQVWNSFLWQTNIFKIIFLLLLYEKYKENIRIQKKNYLPFLNVGYIFFLKLYLHVTKKCVFKNVLQESEILLQNAVKRDLVQTIMKMYIFSRNS